MDGTSRPLKLSSTEGKCILGALYQLQTNAYNFGKLAISPDTDLSRARNNWEIRGLDEADAWRLFFGTMTPW